MGTRIEPKPGLQLSGAGGDDDGTLLSRPDLGLFAIADPIGRTAVAARFALARIEEAVASVRRRDDPAQLLREAITEAEMAYAERIEHHAEERGHGAALAIVLFGPQAVTTGHLGDARIHQVRHGSILRRTEDHLLAGQPHIVIRGFGMASEPDVGQWATEPLDLLLLTSNGVHGFIDDDDIERLCAAHHDLGCFAGAMIESAAKANGTDALLVLAARQP